MLNDLSYNILNDYINIEEDNEIKKYNYKMIQYENYYKYECNICEKTENNILDIENILYMYYNNDEYKKIKPLYRLKIIKFISKKSLKYLINRIKKNRMLYNIILYKNLDIECYKCNIKLLGEIIF